MNRSNKQGAGSSGDRGNEPTTPAETNSVTSSPVSPALVGPSRRLRLLLVLLGLIISQAILFGPSLLGQRILLPLDLLGLPRCYLPETPQYADVEPGNQVFSDLILEYEPNRVFATEEIRQGRLPLWNPYTYTGAPFVGFPKFSPFMWPYYLFRSPLVIAWTQLLVALVTGVGAYLYFRRALGAAFWPAALGAWCYPLTGFFMMWQGFTLTYGAALLPWILLSTDRTIRNPKGWGGPSLALLVGLVLVSTQPDIAGQSLLASGIYAVGCWFAVFGRGTGTSTGRISSRSRVAGWAIGSVVGAWLLGFLLASPHLLPFVEYVQTGSRYVARVEGHEERPPVGIVAIPQMLVPDIYGSSRSGSVYLGPINQLESPSAGYTGLLLTLVLAPLAFRDRARRQQVGLLGVLALIASSWTLGLPGFVQILRLPLLDIMSHNRFVFVSSFALVGLAVIGINALRGATLARRWAVMGSVLPLALAVFCTFRVLSVPAEITSDLTDALRRGEPDIGATSIQAIERIARSFRSVHIEAIFLSVVAIGAYLTLASRRSWRRFALVGLGGLAWLELVSFSFGFHPQADPRLYYPSIPALEELGAGTEDRVMGAVCLPAPLGQRFGLKDVRGYDGIDPARLIDLLDLCWDPGETGPRHSATQWLAPVVDLNQDGDLVLSPILSLMDVRYLVFRGAPPPGLGVAVQSDDYWAAENPSALPRPFVPLHVAAAPDRAELLARMGDPQFDPRALAFVEATDSPALSDILNRQEPARGEAHIVEEHPQRIEIQANMDTPGLLILSDLWDPGWQATMNGQRVPIFRADHAFRGIAAPPGRSSIILEYRPATFYRGLWLALAALLLGSAWAAWTTRRFRSRHSITYG